MSITLLADDLHCNQPFIKNLQTSGCKEGSHKYLYDWISTLRQGGDLKTITIKKQEKNRILIYR